MLRGRRWSLGASSEEGPWLVDALDLAPDALRAGASIPDIGWRLAQVEIETLKEICAEVAPTYSSTNATRCSRQDLIRMVEDALRWGGLAYVSKTLARPTGGASAPASAPPTAPPLAESRRPGARPAARAERPVKEEAEPTIRLVNVEAPIFVPGVETNAILYAIDGPVAKVATVRMVVWSVRADGTMAVVEDLEVLGPYAASGKVDWEGRASTAAGMITVKGSPYEVRFVLTSKSGKVSTSEPGRIRVEVHQIRILVQRAPARDVPDAAKPAVDSLIAELQQNGMPRDCEGRLVIDTPLFKVRDQDEGPGRPDEMSYDASSREYQEAIGDGPTVPLVAQIDLRSKSGGGMRSPPVLAGLRILWDFKLASSADLDGVLTARDVQPEAKAFMKKVASHEETATRPIGTSAHVTVGGWRAKSADRDAAGRQWAAVTPWTMTRPARRDWAAFTECGTDVAETVDSALSFLPGRMAGDIHRLRAAIDVDDALDVADESAPDIRPPAAHRSNAIKIINWRRIPVVGNWTVGPRTVLIELRAADLELRRAGVIIEAAAGVVSREVGASWKTFYQTEVARAFERNWPFFKDALLTDPGDFTVRFRDFLDYWERANGDSGSFGALGQRIKAFFGAGGEDDYKKRCDDEWYWLFHRVAQHLVIPDRGMTVMKFGTNGPHNQNPGESFTAGIAPSIAGVTARTRAIFFQFTVAADTETLLHEIGHVLFLAHAPGHFEAGKQPAGVRPEAHDRAQVCLMSYHPSKRHFCGLCLLKLAGWNVTRLRNDGSYGP